MGRWVLYIFGLYNLVLGGIAIVYPPITAVLYSLSSFSPEWAFASRWVGALAVAIGYAAFSFAQTGNREVKMIIIISAAASLLASILGIINGEAGIVNIAFDSILQAAVIIVLVFWGDTRNRPSGRYILK